MCFAREMAARMEVQTGRCGPVDDTGGIIDKLHLDRGTTVDRPANTRRMQELLRAFDADGLTQTVIHTRREVKPTLAARRLLAEKLQEKSLQLIAPKLNAGTNFASQLGVLPSAYRFAVGLVLQTRWRLMLPVEMSRLLMGRAPRSDFTWIRTFCQPRERHYEKLSLTLAPAPDE